MDKLNTKYDSDADVLYVSFGEPQEAISDNLTEDIIIRRDPSTGDVVGLTLLVTDPSVFFTDDGSISLLWEDKNGKDVEIEFFPDRVEYYVEAKGEEGEIPFLNARDGFGELTEFFRRHTWR